MTNKEEYDMEDEVDRLPILGSEYLTGDHIGEQYIYVEGSTDADIELAKRSFVGVDSVERWKKGLSGKPELRIHRVIFKEKPFKLPKA